MEEGFNKKFAIVIKEAQKLGIKAATASSRELRKSIDKNSRTNEYYRLKIDKKIDYIEEMMGILPFKTDISYFMSTQKNVLHLLSMILNERDTKKRYQGLKTYYEFKKIKIQTNYTYWKEYSIRSNEIETQDG